jgi:predicted RNase H-like HicB family nuclease
MLKPSISGNQITISFENLPVQVIKEGEYFVFYTSILELSSYGKTLEEGEKNFLESLDIFLEEAIKDNNLVDQLIKIGWTIEGDTIRPPTYIGTLNISKRDKITALS